MSNEIARVEFGEEVARKVIGEKKSVRPQVVVERDHYGDPLWTFSSNGWQGTGVNISVEMFDALRELVTNAAVVEHYESLRKPRYENGCTGDPVLVPGSFRTERNKP